MGKPNALIKKYFIVFEISCIAVICVALIYNAVQSVMKTNETKLLFFYLSFCCLTAGTTYILRKHLLRSSILVRMAFMMCLALIIRGITCHFLNVTQQGDYSVYLSAAKKIASGEMEPSLYYGIFPHALNYPIFLSVFYKVLGILPWLPKAINLLLGVAEVGLIVGIAERCADSKFSLLAGVLAVINPCIVIFTILTGGEPVYDVLILGALFCLLNAKGKGTQKAFIWIAASGIVCGLGNFFRPTGIIFVIAVLIQLFVFDSKAWKEKLTHTAVFVLAFAAVAFSLGLITDTVSGYKSPTQSFGWNLYVGANQDSKGAWNQADQQVFIQIMKQYDDPSQIQRYFAKEGIERYKDMKLGIIRHFVNKLYVWFDERFVSNAVSQWQNQYTIFKSSDILQVYSLICFYFNSIVVLLAMVSMLFSGFSKKTGSGLKISTLYMLGSILTFMVLESSPRYKGAYYGMMTFLAAYGAAILWSRLSAAVSRLKLLGEEKQKNSIENRDIFL